MASEANVETILREAVQSETEAHAFYSSAVSLVEAEDVKDTLRQLAREELGHRATLERMLASPGALRRRVRKSLQGSVQDYKIGDHLVLKPLSANSTFQDVCIVASRKEQQSCELYRGLAEQNEGEPRDLLEAMAKDELRHKNLVEGWYEQVIYREF